MMKKESFIIFAITLLIWSGCTALAKQDQNSIAIDVNTSGKITKVASIAPPQTLMVPSMAYDDSSIMLIWSKPSDYSNVASYNVYKNGSLAGNTKNLFYEVGGLDANSSYSFTVKAVGNCGTESPAGNILTQSTASAMKVFKVTDYGAVGDGNTLNTAAIQKAIDECAKGGKVLIPSGTFLSGALFLKSNMTLQIDGTLLGSDNAADYPLTCMRFPYHLAGKNYMGLINAYTENYGSITNVRICGLGNVCGGTWAGGRTLDTTLGINEKAANGGNDSARGDLIEIKGVTNFYIGGLTLTNPAMHTIFITYCKNITVSGITVRTYDIHNADGINICTSDTAYVFNSTFDTGDDCINLNAGIGADSVRENFPDNNLRIFNCTTKRGHGGVVFGSFTGAWIQNVLVEDCVFDGTDRGLRFKTGQHNGGGARNVLCRDLIIKNIAKEAAIFIDSNYPPSKYPSAGAGQFKDITVKNITCTNLKKYGVYVNGLPDMPHTNISISNISIDGAKKGGVRLKYCTNSTFDTVNITNSTPAWTIDPNSTSGLIFKNCNPAP
jgi:exo-poly-alpha-galacturonosidase